jgi:hypothetical protein
MHDVEELEQQALAAAADADAARDARDILRATHARRADRDALLVDLATAQEDLALARTALNAQTRALETERDGFQEELRGLRTSLQAELQSAQEHLDSDRMAFSERTHALEVERDGLQAELRDLRTSLQAELQLTQEHWASDRTCSAERTRALEAERDTVREELRGTRISHQGKLQAMIQARDSALAAASRAADADALDSRNDAVLALILAARFARGAHVAVVSEVEACMLFSTAALRRRDELRQLRERPDYGKDRILTLTQIIEGIRDLAQLKTRDDALRGRLACIAKLATLEDAEAST